jgi:predicted flavoprotein YhiN
VSRAITAAKNPLDVTIVADFLPNLSVDAVDAWLRQSATTEGKRRIANLAIEPLQRSLVQELVDRAGVPSDRRIAELTKQERSKIIAQLKRCEIAITGTRGFDKAEVTAGDGVRFSRWTENCLCSMSGHLRSGFSVVAGTFEYSVQRF